MPATIPAVELLDVSKQYADGPVVLDRFTLTAARGDFISLIGPSGCGKSTLLRLVAGLSEVTTGSIRVNGHPPGASAADLSYVFQEPTLLPWLTARKNVEVPLILRRFSRPDRNTRAVRALEQVGLAERAGAYPRQLSGGQKMRVSIARALATSPEVLLLDEPFGALDEITRDRLNEELLEIRERQAWTAFFVTHSVAEAVFLSNRIVVLAADPGRTHAEFSVPFPYPRRAELRQTDEFHHLVVAVSRSLRSIPSLPPK